MTFAQPIPEKGVPFLENFTPIQYQNSGKIWDIKTAPNGMVYMAADKGLLEYDGKTWNIFKGSKGFTRSLLVLSDSLVYTGSDHDFGVWRKNAFQGFEYTSLYPFQEMAQDVSEEFWDVYQYDNAIIFVSSQSIYVYQNEQFIKTAAPTRFVGSYLLNGTLYLADSENGLYVYENYSLRLVFEYPGELHLEMAGVFENADGLVVVTRNQGLFQVVQGHLSRLENDLAGKLEQAKLFSFERIGDDYLAFGTVLKGLYVTDYNGQIIHHINRNKGLPSNTVLALHYSQAAQLWLGMDYGVSSISLHDRYTWIFDYRGDFGTGYTAMLENSTFYLGTNQGLYSSDWDGLNNNLEFFDFKMIPETEGQVWTLESIDKSVLMGHDKGLFIVNRLFVEKIPGPEGVWSILPYKGYLLTGNYNGISIYHKQENRWRYLRNMELILGSCNQLIIEKDNILWVNIPNFGLIRAELNEELNPEERIIFPMEDFKGNDAYLQKSEEGIQVLTDQFQYTYHASENKFLEEPLSLGKPRLEGVLPGIYKSVVLNSDNEFFPVYNGFALKSLVGNDLSEPRQYALTIRKIKAYRNLNEKLIFNGAEVPFSFNNFHIECIVPNQEDALYQYRLNDENDWSEWSPDHAFDLVGMPPGGHEVRVRALVNGVISSEQSVWLNVSPPWYRAWYAYLFYVLSILTLINVIRTRHKKALKKQKQEMQEKEQHSLREQEEVHRQELRQLEQDRLQAEYGELQQQLKTKTIELANKARDNEEKNRLILSLKEACRKAQENPSISKLKLAEMTRLLDSYLSVEDNTFEIQMDELHQGFFKKLKEMFPDLSSNDLRLCAYLKIGLSSKEIADILNILPSSSYIRRSRLRKKLNLQTDEDLYSFLNKIT